MSLRLPPPRPTPYPRCFPGRLPASPQLLPRSRPSAGVRPRRAVSGDAYLRAAAEAPLLVPLPVLGVQDCARGTSGIAAGSPGSGAPRVWEDPGAGRGARAGGRGCGDGDRDPPRPRRALRASERASPLLLVCGSYFFGGAPVLTGCRAAGAMSVSEIFVELQGFLAAEQDIREASPLPPHLLFPTLLFLARLGQLVWSCPVSRFRARWVYFRPPLGSGFDFSASASCTFPISAF